MNNPLVYLGFCCQLEPANAKVTFGLLIMCPWLWMYLLLIQMTKIQLNQYSHWKALPLQPKKETRLHLTLTQAMPSGEARQIRLALQWPSKANQQTWVLPDQGSHYCNLNIQKQPVVQQDPYAVNPSDKSWALSQNREWVSLLPFPPLASPVH